MDLSGSVAVVSGASSGIGEATARALGREGCAVALVARREDRLADVAEKIDARTLVVPTDVADEDAVRSMVEMGSDSRSLIRGDLASELVEEVLHYVPSGLPEAAARIGV